MQPTQSAKPAEPSAISDFPPSSRPRTAIEAVSTIIQAVRKDDVTPYDAAQRVLAALGLDVNAPLPPSPPTSNGAEDEERAAGSTSLPPPSSSPPCLVGIPVIHFDGKDYPMRQGETVDDAWNRVANTKRQKDIGLFGDSPSSVSFPSHVCTPAGKVVIGHEVTVINHETNALYRMRVTALMDCAKLAGRDINEQDEFRIFPANSVVEAQPYPPPFPGAEPQRWSEGPPCSIHPVRDGETLAEAAARVTDDSRPAEGARAPFKLSARSIVNLSNLPGDDAIST